MTPAQIAQLILILAPIVKDVAVEGVKFVATIRDNFTQEDLDKALEASKSATWPELDFVKAAAL